ncbi:MAG: response regulator [Candidatus Daviesbacteria bacterium]
MAKVLIIEDEKAMSDLIAIKFKVDGFEVEQAGTLTEAKAKLSSVGPFDAILTDFLLPDGELVDFLTTLRADPQTATLPIVMMTNYIEDVNVDKLKQLGVAEILVKYQVVPAQMVEKIKNLIGGKAPQPAQSTPQPQSVTPVPPQPTQPIEPEKEEADQG